MSIYKAYGYLLEGVEEKLEYFKKIKPNTTIPNDVLPKIKEIDPSGKFTIPLLNWFTSGDGTYDLPSEEIKDTINKFKQLSTKPGFPHSKDLNTYKTYQDLVSATTENKTQNGMQGDYPIVKNMEDLPKFEKGVNFLFNENDMDFWEIDYNGYEAIKVLTSQYGSVAWCVKKEPAFITYSCAMPLIYVAKKGKPYMLIHEHEIKNIHNENIDEYTEEMLSRIIKDVYQQYPILHKYKSLERLLFKTIDDLFMTEFDVSVDTVVRLLSGKYVIYDELCHYKNDRNFSIVCAASLYFMDDYDLYELTSDLTTPPKTINKQFTDIIDICLTDIDKQIKQNGLRMREDTVLFAQVKKILDESKEIWINPENCAYTTRLFSIFSDKLPY